MLPVNGQSVYVGDIILAQCMQGRNGFLSFEVLLQSAASDLAIIYLQVGCGKAASEAV